MTVKMFLFTAIVMPWIGGFATRALFKNDSFKSGIASSIISLAIFYSAAQMYPTVYGGDAVVEINGFFTGNILLGITPIGYIFTLLTSMVWFASSVFSIAYMRKNHFQGRFYLFFLLTLGATLGVFLSGDMIAFFTFFEIMSLTSFMLVIHEQDKEAIEAGKLYIFMSIFGSLLALMGLFMLYHGTGTLDIQLLNNALQDMGTKKYAIYFLIVLGLGVKAGIVPLHVWLPKAHPAAPSPASAILSGILLKTGIYGILVASLIFWGKSGFAGNIVAVLGAITMVMGAGCALRSSNFKKLLAYSSMSQMGYVVLSIGTAVALGEKGWLGYAGGIYQAVNHGIYEAMLFLIAGYLFLLTGTIELDELKGICRKEKTAAIFLVIGLAAITGLPGLNGFIGKTLIHDALLEAVHETHSMVYKVLEKVFVLGSSLTAAYCYKIVEKLFSKDIGKENREKGKVTGRAGMFLSYILLTLGIIYTGIFPKGLLALLSPGLYPLHQHNVHFFGLTTLLGPVKAYLLGFAVYLIFRTIDSKLKQEKESRALDIFDFASSSVSAVCEEKRSDKGISEKVAFIVLGKIDRSGKIMKKLSGYTIMIFEAFFNVIKRVFIALDRGFSFESNIYRPIIDGVYGLLSAFFGYIDRGVDFFYTVFTSFLTGIYHREDEETSGEVTGVIEIRERALLYKKYRGIIREIAHGHFQEAGRMVREYFRDKEYKTFNLNIGVIIFAAMVVVFMLIFVMYVPILSNGIAVY
jgi:formate hydrogenlyase subunit 3/multisubunit Na+/H+ antiporter MnhD subunit